MKLIDKILKTLSKNKINFYTGVPDSVLKPLSIKLSKFNQKNHIIAANEGGAVSIATGYHLATKKIPVIYLQNSGLGNIINPITSMISKKIYGIPMILFIGWRGYPGSKDEIQHTFQGKITLNQLKMLNIKYKVFNKKNFTVQLKHLIKHSKKQNEPVAYLFKKNDMGFDDLNFREKNFDTENFVSRSEFIFNLIQNNKISRIIATTGFTSRELYQIRSKYKNSKSRDFYLVGAMGHSSMVALGYSSVKKNKEVVCLDGDGSFLMHLGSSIISSKFGKNNFKYILLNNECHESVGKQATSIDQINLKKFCLSIGYKKYFIINKKRKIQPTIKKFINSKGPSFLEVKINRGTLPNLARIKKLNIVKKFFMK